MAMSILARFRRWLFPEDGMISGIDTRLAAEKKHAALEAGLTSLQRRLDFMEQRNKELGNALFQMQQGSKESAYLGEVSEIYAAMGPQAFKGAIATIFATPAEVMQARGESEELKDALANATRAVEQNTKLTGQLLVLASRLSAIEQKILPENATDTVQ